jgi:hypothetical protein
MVAYRDRRGMRQELVAQGYSWEYLDEWQAKTTLYRHAPGLNVQGAIVFPSGTEIKGVPGNPDYVLKKARIGMFPYPPSSACTCRWCKDETKWADATEKKVVNTTEYACDTEGCGFTANGKTHSRKLSSLRMHARNKHKL